MTILSNNDIGHRRLLEEMEKIFTNFSYGLYTETPYRYNSNRMQGYHFIHISIWHLVYSDIVDSVELLPDIEHGREYYKVIIKNTCGPNNYNFRKKNQTLTYNMLKKNCPKNKMVLFYDTYGQLMEEVNNES